MRRTFKTTAILSTLLTMATAAIAWGAPRDLGPATSRLDLEIGQGRLIRLGTPARSVMLADPKVADLEVRSPTLIYLAAKSPGTTNLIALDGQDQVEANIEVVASYDETGLLDDLKRLVPGAHLKVSTANNSLVLSGAADSAADAASAEAIALKFVPDPAHLINSIAVDAPNEVNLRVRIAEVDREVVKQLGFNWGSVGGKGQFGFGVQTGNATTTFNQTSTGTTGTASNTFVPNASNLLLGYNSGIVDINVLIDALETVGLVTVLAEPNLTAVSGAPASFLAGGQYPIPVPQGLGVTTIEFKDYGVSLGFVATIVDSGRINLKVEPEVSELSSQGAITLNGQTIPAITTRRAKTTVDLASGQSLALAGLIQNNYNQMVTKFPGLGNVPVLGALFRSESFQHDETELVIIVTPYIVHPSSARLSSPTDGYIPPTDVALALYGDDYAAHIAAGHLPQTLSGRALIGPSGLELE